MIAELGIAHRCGSIVTNLFASQGWPMPRPVNHTIEHFKSIGWVLLLLYVFLGLFALVAGRIIGFSMAVWCSVGLGVIVTVVFASIILLNVTFVGTMNMIRRLFGRDK